MKKLEAAQPVEQTQETVERTNKQFRSIFKGVVNVKLGEGSAEETFIVHTDRISHHSKFFKVACSARWSESGVHAVKLQNFCPDRFKVYLEWVYGEKSLLGFINTLAEAEVECYICEVPHGQPSNADPEAQFLGVVSDLWTLGDYLDDVDFLNEILNCVHTARDWNIFRIPGLNKVFDNLPSDGPLQRNLVDHAVSNPELIPVITDCSPSLQLALLKAFITKSENQGTFDKGQIDLYKYLVQEKEAVGSEASK